MEWAERVTIVGDSPQFRFRRVKIGDPDRTITGAHTYEITKAKRPDAYLAPVSNCVICMFSSPGTRSMMSALKPRLTRANSATSVVAR